MGTHTGVGVVQYKARNKVLGGAGYDYATPVSYWMPFNGGEGLHDADWRSTFGGTIYKNNGSHGCVNLPPSAAATIYGIIDAGWPVVVYY
jgi:lipoprotein-anchoring transpeptidase ErfK/SrfK